MLKFKPSSAWRFVGKDTATYDQQDIVTGKAQFGLDVFRDGMVHASIEHPPVLGGTIRSVDDTATKSVKGVQQTVQAGHVQAAAPVPAARRRRRDRRQHVGGAQGPAAAQGRLERRRARRRSSRRRSRKSCCRRSQKPGKVFRNLGNVDAEFAKGGKVLEATYYTPLAAHASMEPPAAVAEFRDGKVTVWAPTQNPQAVQEAVAAAVGIDKKDVTVPRHAARRRLRPEVEAGLLRGGGGAVEAARQAGQGDLDARRRHPPRLLPHDGGGVSQGVGRRPRQADGVAAAIGVPADRLDVRRRRARAAQLRAGSRARRPALRRGEHPRRERPGRRARAHRLVPRRQQQLPRVRGAQLRRRDGAGGRPRLARVPARHARARAR